MKKCPDCGGEKFIVSAHVVQDWLVGGDGEYIEIADECVTVLHYPTDDDTWYCSECGYYGAGSEFNVPDKPIHYNNSYDREQALYAMRFMECIMIGERSGWLSAFKDKDIEEIQSAFDDALSDYNSPEAIEKYHYFGDFCIDWLKNYEKKYQKIIDKN